MKVNEKEKEPFVALISNRTDVCLIDQIGVPLKFSISLNISKNMILAILYSHFHQGR